MKPTAQSASFEFGGSHVSVTFHGEIETKALLGESARFADLFQPIDANGAPEGIDYEPVPVWLDLEYRIDEDTRRVLVASRPVMNNVSWEAIARVGAALGDNSKVRLGDLEIRQDALLTGQDGKSYRVRLIQCGQSTLRELSEWNLLIGGVHAGDVDFQGDMYGWLSPPYTDSDLKVGYGGSLNWCQDAWSAGQGQRVVRGYFYASRFHATNASFKGDRIFWRPVLELLDQEHERDRPSFPFEEESSSDVRRDVSYEGSISYADLFGDEVGIKDLVRIREKNLIGGGRPDWLEFRLDGKTLLVAAKPVGHSVSWDTITKAGAVTGDHSRIRVGLRTYKQNLEVSDRDGNRYRVRLLRCGKSTLDHASEWNALIGGAHRGDGDFVPAPGGVYGWINRPMSDAELHIGVARGTATWCQETDRRGGKRHATNRGYLTVSRYHSTISSYTGYGFSWRPVLERIDG